MKYYLLPGRYFSLSKAELLSIIDQYCKQYTLEEKDNLFLVDTEDDISQLFKRLGGFISYGSIIEDLETFLDQFEDRKKILFGINVYGSWKLKEVKQLYDKIKDEYKSRGVSAKYPKVDQTKLNAGSVIQNKILEKGFLLEIIETQEKTYYGQCLAVQNIDEYSMIEYEKPYTDKKMGVLPAKLSRILVNLAGIKAGQTIWDPFCGSGTILLEAFRLGINIIGSDISDNVVEICKENIKWLGKKIGDENILYQIFRFDVTKPDSRITSLLRKTDVHAVACEPYMGPPQLKAIPPFTAKKLLGQVKVLYSNLFGLLERIKLDDFKAVIIIPSYRTKDGWMTISVSDIVGKKWEIENKKYGGDLHWERENSIIRRNIFILKKKF